jgi:hypothetical protein
MHWTLLLCVQLRGVRAYMLQYALQASGDPAATVVRSTLVATVALVLKRGWQDEPGESRAQFLQASGMCGGGREGGREGGMDDTGSTSLELYFLGRAVNHPALYATQKYQI